MPDGELVKYSPRPTAFQSYTWKLYLNSIRYVASIANGDDVVIIHNGDMTQGVKYPDEVVSNSFANHILIALANLEPWVKIPNLRAVRFSIGTPSHTSTEGGATVLVRDGLRRKFPELDVAVVYHGLLDIFGVTVDYAHHGPYPGSREWLKGNSARFYLRDMMITYIMAHKQPPKLVLRSHYHEFIKEQLTITTFNKMYESMLVVTPSFLGIDGWTRQAVKSRAMLTHGLVVFEIIDGEIYKVHPITQSIDIRTKEVVRHGTGHGQRRAVDRVSDTIR
jgi:hypothetical protein